MIYVVITNKGRFTTMDRYDDQKGYVVEDSYATAREKAVSACQRRGLTLLRFIEGTIADYDRYNVL